jgi:hypothetical protein
MSKKSKPGDGSHGKGKKGGPRFEEEEMEVSFFGRVLSFFRGLF